MRGMGGGAYNQNFGLVENCQCLKRCRVGWVAIHNYKTPEIFVAPYLSISLTKNLAHSTNDTSFIQPLWEHSWTAFSNLFLKKPGLNFFLGIIKAGFRAHPRAAMQEITVVCSWFPDDRINAVFVPLLVITYPWTRFISNPTSSAEKTWFPVKGRPSDRSLHLS